MANFSEAPTDNCAKMGKFLRYKTNRRWCSSDLGCLRLITFGMFSIRPAKSRAFRWENKRPQRGQWGGWGRSFQCTGRGQPSASINAPGCFPRSHPCRLGGTSATRWPHASSGAMRPSRTNFTIGPALRQPHAEITHGRSYGAAAIASLSQSSRSAAAFPASVTSYTTSPMLTETPVSQPSATRR